MSDRSPVRDAREGHLWYFAYGSNLDPDTFLRRRGMRPVETMCVCAPGRKLVFDLAIGPGERGVANLIPDPRSATWGVAYEVSREQADWLDRTEGVPSGGYRRVFLEVSARDGTNLAAFTYSSDRGVEGRKPSPRYMRIILAGARHHALPSEWILRLESLELAADERVPAESAPTGDATDSP
jgi:cation transport regulator ChaC